MGREDNRRREEELDRFWEIDDLIPKRRATHYAADTEAQEIVVEAPHKQENHTRTVAIPKPSGQPRPHFIPPHSERDAQNAPKPEEEYTPQNALIRAVRLYRWRSNYQYYETFVRDAERLLSAKGEECPRVPFFSYVPQYGQMTRPQLEWYLWWRNHVRRGSFLDTDYSYVLLYVFEIINLGARQDVREAQRMLCALWAHYRKLYRQLDSYLPEWICDFSLIHRLPPPDFARMGLLSEAMAHCTLKEFYVPVDGERGYLQALLIFCSNYDYRKSKFYIPENASLFDTAVLGALETVTERLSADGRLFSASGMEDSRLVRDAYTGALCSYRAKRRIEVEYCSFSRSHELRFFITDVVKYTENKLRAALGIRSRLSIYAIPVPVREQLDAYLTSVLPKKQTVARAAVEPPAEYEKLYDLPKKSLSLTDAAEIERLSWQTTERLVDAFEETSEEPSEAVAQTPCVPPPLPTAPTLPVTDGEEDLSALSAHSTFLRAVLEGDAAGQCAYAKEQGMLPEVLADEINETAAELLGDILLEEGDGMFLVIEDYRDTVLEMLERNEKNG